jgi:hypothetical protein
VTDDKIAYRNNLPAQKDNSPSRTSVVCIAAGAGKTTQSRCTLEEPGLQPPHPVLEPRRLPPALPQRYIRVTCEHVWGTLYTGSDWTPGWDPRLGIEVLLKEFSHVYLQSDRNWGCGIVIYDDFLERIFTPDLGRAVS